MLFVTAAGPFLAPANTTEGSIFSAALPTLVIFVVFSDSSRPKEGEMVSPSSFYLCSPNDE